MASTWKAARDTAYNISWLIGTEASPDQELSDSESLKNLRLRSRQLIKDNPVVAAAQQAYINMIHNGGPTVKSMAESAIQRRQINDVIEETSAACDMTGLQTFNEIIEQIIAWSWADGDILISLPIDTEASGLQTRVELIEAYRIKTPNQPAKSGSVMKSNIRHGVQYDKAGRIEGYWVKKADKVDERSDREDYFDYYPVYTESGGLKRKVTQLFKAPLNARPNMSRGYPITTPLVALLNHIDQYLEATIVGARVAACFSAFITSNAPAGTWKGMTTDANGAILDPTDANSSRRVQKLQPGNIAYLKPNEDISFASPNRPGDNADPFILRMYKTVAMYYRIPYSILFLDLADTNYSSWRGGAIETIKMVNRWHDRLNGVIKWIVNTWVLEGIILGVIRGSVSNAKVVTRWKSSGILDPEKEARANKVRKSIGAASGQMIAEEQGLDYDELQQEIWDEEEAKVEHDAKVLKMKKDLEEKLGVIFPDTVQPEEEKKDDRDTSSSRREGEDKDSDLDEEDAKERRKEDGNW